jgi:hypothetical protein
VCGYRLHINGLHSCNFAECQVAITSSGRTAFIAVAVPFLVPRTDWRAGHERDSFAVVLFAFPVAACSEQAQQVVRDLVNHAGQAGRGQEKPEHDACQGMPHFQGRVPSQQEYQHAKDGNYRDRDCRQSTTSFLIPGSAMAGLLPVVTVCSPGLAA